MLWFSLHTILASIFPYLEGNQTKNLFIFLMGVMFYTFLYTWFGTINRTDNVFIFTLFNYFWYIILADGFSMAIIYKNYFKTSIFREVNETFGLTKPEKIDINPNLKQTPKEPYDFPILNKKIKKNSSIEIPLLSSTSHNGIDEREGFEKDSALNSN
jgi:hypothetical protein